MANPEFEALKIANDVSLNSVKKKEIEQKNRYQKGEIGLKRAQILSALPSSTDTAGDSLIGAANSMAQSPRNASTGIVEGLLRAFGGNLKGKAADEKRKQIMDALDVLDYTMEGEEYLQKTQEQIAKQKNDMQYRLSQKQYEQAYSDGTLDQTLKATFQQIGIDPNNVQLSSDGLNVYIEKDGKITKAPVSDFFSPEDSQKFQFINSTQKANLAQSENKQVQGLAQENNMLKSRLDVLEEQYKQMGMNPAISKSLARGVVNEERIQQNEEAMKERGFSLQERGLGIQQQNADTSSAYLDLEKNKLNSQNVENPYGSIPVSALGGKGLTPFTNTISSEANLAKDIPVIFKQIKEAQQIIKDTPELGTIIINALGKTDITKALMSDEVRPAFEKVDKISNRVVESFIRARGNITDEERKTIKQGIFNVFLSGKANEYNSKSIIEELERSYLRGNFSAEQLSKGFIATPQGFEKFLEENPQAVENVRNKFNLNSSDEEMITVVNPQGISGKMPKANLQKALESGYKVK